MRKRVIAGVDIGGTKTAVVLSVKPPHILTRLVFATEPERGPAHAIASIIDCLRKALASQGCQPSDIDAIGISCGGPLDPVQGIIQSPPNLLTWKDVAIRQRLEAEFAVSCYLENDANAGALAEASFGAGQGFQNVVFLTMGTGLGAGLILGGELYRGTSHAAGEIGHVRLTRSGPWGYGKSGSVEGWASGGGMAQVAMLEVRSALLRGTRTLLEAQGGGAPDAITARDVAHAFRQGDAVAMTVVRKVGEKLGEAIAILIDIVNPECIVVGGLALRFGEALLAPARKVAAREALQTSAASCRVVSAALGEQIGDVAALCAAMKGMAAAQRPPVRATAASSMRDFALEARDEPAVTGDTERAEIIA